MSDNPIEYPVITEYANGATGCEYSVTPEQLARRAANKNENRDPRWVDATEAQRQRAIEKGMRFPDVARPTWLAHYVLDVKGWNVHRFMSDFARYGHGCFANSQLEENAFSRLAAGEASLDEDGYFMLSQCCMGRKVEDILAPYTPEGEEPASDLGSIALWTSEQVGVR